MYTSSSEGYCSLDLNSENLSLSSNENVSEGKFKHPSISVYDNLNLFLDERRKSPTDHVYAGLTMGNVECLPIFPNVNAYAEEQIYANLNQLETDEFQMLKDLFKSLSIEIENTNRDQIRKLPHSLSSSSSTSSLDEEICRINYPNHPKRKQRRHKRKDKRTSIDYDTSSDSFDEINSNRKRFRIRRLVIQNDPQNSKSHGRISQDEKYATIARFPLRHP